MDGWRGVEEPELHDDPTLEGEGEEGGRAAGVAGKHSNLWFIDTTGAIQYIYICVCISRKSVLSECWGSVRSSLIPVRVRGNSLPRQVSECHKKM